MGPGLRHVPAGRNYTGGQPADIQGSRILKKLEEAGGSQDENPAGIELDTIILAGIERGLTLSDIKRMTLGQVVDFCMSYNERQKKAQEAQNADSKAVNTSDHKTGGYKYRMATQDEIDAYFR